MKEGLRPFRAERLPRRVDDDAFGREIDIVRLFRDARQTIPLQPRSQEGGKQVVVGLICNAQGSPVAREMRCRFLLIDARRGRQIARRLGITIVGLAGVLLAAKQRGRLESVGSVLAALARQGYRLSDALVAEVLRLAGETHRQGE